MWVSKHTHGSEAFLRIFFLLLLLFFFFFTSFKGCTLIYFIVVLLQLSQFPPPIVPIFPLLFSPAPSIPPPCSHSQPPSCCLCPWVLYIHSLTRPFPLFPLLSISPLPSGHCQFIPYFHVSGSMLLLLFILPITGQFSILSTVLNP